MKRIAESVYCFITIMIIFFFFLPTVSALNSGEGLKPSSFLDLLETEDYPSYPNSDEAQLLRWDFSGDKTYTFDYYQKGLASTDSNIFKNQQDSDTAVSTEGRGKLSFKSQNNHTAHMVLEDFVITLFIPSGKDSDPRELKTNQSPVVVQGVKEDGSMQTSDNSYEILMKLFFPLPEKAVKPGEELITPVSIPFNFMGSPLNVKGKTSAALTDFVQINGKKCARLETVIDISEIEIPEELEGESKCIFRGNSVSYFNMDDNCFMEGKLVLKISISIDVPTPGMTVDGKENKMEMPARMSMAMESDNFISIKFKESNFNN